MDKDLHISENVHKLVLINDDHNTFEKVVQTLVDVCEHSPIQAEQCALLVHYKGKCEVWSSDKEFEVAIKMYALSQEGLNVEMY